jgi:two-component system response regulator YesN
MELFKNKFNVSLRFQHLAFYIALLIVPSLILSYIIHFYLLDDLEKEVIVSNEQRITQIKEVIDSKLAEIDHISSGISRKREFSPNYLTDYYHVMKAQELLNYANGNNFIRDIFYFSRDKNYLFSNKTSHTFPRFSDYHYNYANWSTEALVKDISESNVPFLRSAENVTFMDKDKIKLITYVVPVPFNSSHPYGTLMFMINESVIVDLLENAASSTEGYAFIVNENNEVITSYNGGKLDVSMITNRVKKDNQNSFDKVSISSESYYYSSVKSEFKDWNYIIINPKSDLMMNLNKINKNVMLAYIIILAIGILFIYIAMNKNYRPVKRLINRIEESFGNTTKGKGIEKVWEGISQSILTNQKLSARIENSRPIIEQHLFNKLLCGEIQTYKDFNQLGKEIDLFLHQSSYFVMLFDFAKASNDGHQKIIDKKIQALPNEEKHTVYLMESSTLAVILSGEVDNKILTDWYNQEMKPWDNTVTVGVGNTYQDATEIGKSHLEAATALDYRLIKGTDQTIFFNEIVTDVFAVKWYDKQIIDDIEYQIRRNDKKEVDKLVQRIVSIIEKKEINLFIAKSLLFDLSSTLIRMVQELQQRYDTIDFPNVLQINDFNSVDDVRETIQLMIYQVLELYEKVEPKKDDLIKHVMDFVEENYDNYQLSTQMLAEHFSLSEAYIMREFKKKTGKTILQYLTDIRIERSKQILKTTNIPIKDIVIQVGYSDVSSFIRKFKQLTKCTPGEYRKKYTTIQEDIVDSQ